jgi:hypothetical protein
VPRQAHRAILIFAHILGIWGLTFVTERDQPDSRVVTNVPGDRPFSQTGLRLFSPRIVGLAMSYAMVLRNGLDLNQRTRGTYSRP